MRKHRWLRLVAVASVLALALAACGGDDDDDNASGSTSSTAAAAADRGNVDGTLAIGALLPQSGDLAVIYDALHVPITMAIDEINAAGGVNGQQVTLADADDGTSPDVAAGGLDTLLTSDKVDAIVGPASSGTMEGIVDKVASNGVVTCSGSNTSAALTDAKDDGYYFRTAPPDKFQGPALAQLILGDGKSKVAILARNDSYGTGFADTLEQSLTDGGATVTTNAPYDPAATDLSSDVQAVVATAPDAVVVIGFNDDGSKIVKEMIAEGAGPDKVAIYTADGMQSSKFAASVDAANPAAVSGIKGTAPAASPGGVTHPFIAAYAATGNDTIFSVYYYDCTMLIALAAQSAGSDDPAKIKDAMLEVSEGGTKCQAYADCLALLKAGEDIDYDGASGAVDLSKVGEPTNGVYDVWAYGADGKYANVDGRRADQDLGVVTETAFLALRRAPGFGPGLVRVHGRICPSERRLRPTRVRRSSSGSVPSARSRAVDRRSGLLDLGEGAEVELDDLGIREQRVAGAFVGVAALIEHVAAVGDLEHPAGVLLDDQHRNADVVDARDALEHVVLHHRRQSGRRLVEQQHRRLHHQRACHRQHLALAAREGTGALVQPLTETRQQADDVVAPLAEVARPQVGAHPQVVVDREAGEDVADLRDVADAAFDELVGAAPGDVFTTEHHGTGADRHEPEHRLQQRRLAGTVRPDDADDLALFDDEVAAMEDVDPGQVAGDDGGRLEQAHCAPSGRSPWCAPRYASMTDSLVTMVSGGPSAMT